MPNSTGHLTQISKNRFSRLRAGAFKLSNTGIIKLAVNQL